MLSVWGISGLVLHSLLLETWCSVLHHSCLEMGGSQNVCKGMFSIWSYTVWRDFINPGRCFIGRMELILCNACYLFRLIKPINLSINQSFKPNIVSESGDCQWYLLYKQVQSVEEICQLPNKLALKQWHALNIWWYPQCRETSRCASTTSSLWVRREAMSSLREIMWQARTKKQVNKGKAL